jgi:hypothetical protein
MTVLETKPLGLDTDSPLEQNLDWCLEISTEYEWILFLGSIGKIRATEAGIP